MKLNSILFITVLLIFLSVDTLKPEKSIAVRGDAGTNVFSILSFELGAREAAMGGSFTSVSDEIAGIYSNPAGLSRIRKHEVSLQHTKLMLDLDMQYAGYAMPITKRDVLGFSGVLLDLGKFPLVTVSNSGDLVESGSFTAGSYNLALSYSHQFLDILNVGFNLKYAHNRIDRFKSQAFAADVGMIYRTPIRPLRVALSIMNIGPTVKFVQEREKLPLRLNVGVSYSAPGGRWIYSMDLKKNRGEHVNFYTGGEFWVVPQLAMRAGYNSENNMDNGFTVGAGFRFRDYSVDYAYEPYGNSAFHQITGKFDFGNPVVEMVSQRRKIARKQHLKKKKTKKRGLLSRLLKRKKQRKPVMAKSLAKKEYKEVKKQQPRENPLNRAKKIPGKEIILLTREGEAHFSAGRYEKAIAVFNRILRRAPSEQSIWYNLATCYYITQKYSDAINAYKKSLELNGKDADAHFYLGNSYYYAGLVDEARDEWRKVLINQPEHQMALQLLETTHTK